MVSGKEYRPLSELINLTQQRAIVTGGARGIGLAIAYRLAEAGATVTIADINSEKAKRATEELRGYGFQVSSVQCDVSREEEVKQMVKVAVSQMGGIDILVNNAGIYPFISLTQMAADDFEQVIAVNLKGVFLCSREVSRWMIAQGQDGGIINIASIDSVRPSAKGLAAYDAAKGGVLMLTKSMALELGQYGIRVNAIAPGGILTEGVLAHSAGLAPEKMKARLREFMSRTPLGRMGNADDIGRVALFLASDLASYMTGSLVIVDGDYLIT